MKAVGGRVTCTRGSVPCCRRRAVAAASSDAAARHPSSRQSQIKRRSPAVSAQPRHFAIRPAGQHRNGGQHASRTVPASASGQALSSPGASGTDSSQAGTHAEQYLTWWDRLTGTCVLAATALLALSFLLPLAASPAPAADAVLQSLPAWVVRAAGFLWAINTSPGLSQDLSTCAWLALRAYGQCATVFLTADGAVPAGNAAARIRVHDTHHRLRRRTRGTGDDLSCRRGGGPVGGSEGAFTRPMTVTPFSGYFSDCCTKPWRLLAVCMCCRHLPLRGQSLDVFRQPQRVRCRSGSG